jgi:hypothetical protein
MKLTFAFALLSTVAIVQALLDRKDALINEQGGIMLERYPSVRPAMSVLYKTQLSTAYKAAPIMEDIAAADLHSRNVDAYKTDGVLVSSTCANVLLSGTELFMGAAFAAMILPLLLEILGFSGNFCNINLRNESNSKR